MKESKAARFVRTLRGAGRWTQQGAEVSQTDFGFQWGQVDVVRAAHRDGYLHLIILTPRRQLQVTVTPTGLVRCDERRRKR